MGDSMDASKDPAAASDAPETETAAPEGAATDPTNDSKDAGDAAAGDTAKPSADVAPGALGNGAAAGTDASSVAVPPPGAAASAVAENSAASSVKDGAENTAAPAPAAANAVATEPAGEADSPEDVEAMAAAAIKAALAAAAGSGAGAKEVNGTAATGEAGEQPKKKRTRRGGWDTPMAPGAVVKKGWGDAPKPVAPAVPMNPLQELQRKLAEEQVAAAMGQKPAVTSVSAGAAALGLTMGGMLPGAGGGAARAQTAPVQPSNPKRLYLGSLHYDLKENDIRAIFANFGALKLVDMSHDATTGRHKGFCFIEYVDEKAADAALRTMNGFELAGRAIKVGRPHNTDSGVSGGIDGMGLPAAMQLPGMAAFMAQRSTAAAGAAGSGVAAEQLKAAMTATAPAQTKIYVGNVEPHITTEMIKTVFEPFGMVVGAEMVVDPNNPGNHKGFGFIQYAQETVARTVIETMSNFELAGRTLRVAWAQDQSKPALSVLPPGLTAAGAAAQAAAQAAKAAASAAGGVAAAQAAARLTAATRLQNFGNGGAAGVGSNGGGAPSGVWVSGGVGQSGWGGGLSAVQQQAQVQAQAQVAAAAVAMATQHGVGAATGVAGRASRCMCLVNMLGPEDADDEETKAEILQEFGMFGTVLQFHVHKQRASAGTVVAVRVFVVYSNPAETAAAVQKMHGRFFAGRQPQAKDGSRYISKFMDHHTRWKAVYPIASKDKALDTLTYFNQDYVIPTGNRIQRLRCDKGGEYIADYYRNYCKETGIQMEFAATNTPQQNGVSERDGRTILDMTRCILIDTGLPKFLWGEICETAVFLINRSPHRAIGGTSPYAKLFGKEPDLSGLRAIRVRAFMHKERYGNKLEEKAWEGIILGYGKDSKSHRIYNPHNRRITESRNVTFIETPHRSLKDAGEDQFSSSNDDEDETDE
eukprot:g19885.t1